MVPIKHFVYDWYFVGLVLKSVLTIQLQVCFSVFSSGRFIILPFVIRSVIDFVCLCDIELQNHFFPYGCPRGPAQPVRKADFSSCVAMLLLVKCQATAYVWPSIQPFHDESIRLTMHCITRQFYNHEVYASKMFLTHIHRKRSNGSDDMDHSWGALSIDDQKPS